MLDFLHQVFLHTPAWVFVLLAALIALGVQQCFARTVSPVRVAVLPVAMVLLAALGVRSAFAAQPWALLAWAGVAAAVLAVMLRRPAPAGMRWDAAARRFALPGSAVPLLLILAIFITKYAVAVALAVQPGAAASLAVAVGVSALYGVFSGVFAGRALRLLRLARAEDGVRPEA